MHSIFRGMRNTSDAYVGKTHEARCIQLSGFDLTHFFYLSVSLVCRALRDVHFVPALSYGLCYVRIRTPNWTPVFFWAWGWWVYSIFCGLFQRIKRWIRAGEQSESRLDCIAGWTSLLRTGWVNICFLNDRENLACECVFSSENLHLNQNWKYFFRNL